MRLKRSSFITLSLLVFSALVITDLGVDGGDYSSVKYASIVAIALAMVAAQGFKRYFDGVSAFALGFFIYTVMLFTLFNSPDPASLAIILGYVVCLLIYISSATAGESLFNSVEKFLEIFVCAFVALNFPKIFDPSSYSSVKNQFSGVLVNANAFSGLCGFLLIFCLSKFHKCVRFASCVYYLIISLTLVFYMLLSSSRGALLAVFLSIWFIPFNKHAKRLIFVLVVLFAGVKLLILQSEWAVGFADRDFSEETGRADLFASYIREISGNLLVGVGLGESGGRIKSELSYLDIFLFAGVGAFGFFVFIARGLFFSVAMAFNTKKHGFSWAAPVYVYLCIASIFEGYAANIGSVPSIFLYISAGFVFRNFKTKVVTN